MYMYYSCCDLMVFVIVHVRSELSEIGELVKQLEAEREGGEEGLKKQIADMEVRCTWLSSLVDTHTE